MGGALFSLNAQQLTEENQRYQEETGYIRCMTVENDKMMKEKISNPQTDAQFEAWMEKEIKELRQRRAEGRESRKVYNIPVVVHVIHNGDRVGEGENITDAQVYSQIDVMTEDYRRLTGTRGGANSTGKAVDVEINFCMAKVDPQGNPTTGVNRVNLRKATFNSMDEANNAKAEVHWDPTKYLNMYTMRFGGELKNLLGYAQFPEGSGLDGMPTGAQKGSTDGVVATYNGFGSKDKDDGTFVLLKNYAYGRTMTHEVGHWLGLRHTWGDGDCSKDDFCDDTPVTGKSNGGCDKSTDTCPRSPGKDMVENYMDYTNDDCMDTFTQDQKDRMQIVMSKCVRRKELINSKACEDLSVNDYSYKNTLSLYPNPTSNTINLVSNANELPDSIEIYSVLGKQIASKAIASAADLKMNVSKLQAGIYFVKVKKESSLATLKFIKE